MMEVSVVILYCGEVRTLSRQLHQSHWHRPDAEVLDVCSSQPFRTKWTSNVKNCDFEVPIATFSHEMDVERQKLR